MFRRLEKKFTYVSCELRLNVETEVVISMEKYLLIVKINCGYRIEVTIILTSKLEISNFFSKL